LVRGIEQLHVVLYWLPPAFLAAGALLALAGRDARRRFDARLLSATALASFVFLGVFPRADLNHLVNVLQPAVVVAAVVAAHAVERARRRPRRGFAAATALAATGLAFYAIVAAYWYVDLLSTLDTRLTQRRGGVLVDPITQQMLDFEIQSIRQMTRPREAVLTVPASTMLNFLAERPVPGRYYNLYAVHIAHDGGAGVVDGMRDAGVRVVVADYDDFFSERTRLRDYAPALVDHLRRGYELAFNVSIDEQMFLRRRARPLPARERLDVLADCDALDAPRSRRVLREHLLFRALHHYLEEGTAGAPQSLITTCRVKVPPAAALSLRIGYRQPTRVGEHAELIGEVFAVDPSARPPVPERLVHERIPLGPAAGWSSPPGTEVRVDVSRWADREALLIFRTLFRGSVTMQDLDFRGFAMLWQDPVIEYGPDGSRGAAPRAADYGGPGAASR
jgi:hypothetical protein